MIIIMINIMVAIEWQSKFKSDIANNIIFVTI